MKLFVNARFLTQPISGVQRYGIECSLQIKRQYRQAVFVSPPNILHHDIAAQLDVVIVGSHKGHFWEQVELPAYLRNNGSPALLNLANTAPLLYSNNYITIHDLAFYHHPEWNSKMFAMWYNFMIPRLARGARHIFTVSETIKEELVAIYRISADKVSVTYNGISAEMLAAGRYYGNKEKIVLCVGTFSIRKNQKMLLEAFVNSDLSETYGLVLLGDTNRIFASTGIEEQQLTKNKITILHDADAETLITAYRKAEIVVSLSAYEGFGIPVLEGLYFGCKVLCSDIPVYRELYAGVASFCDPTKLESINQQLKLLSSIDPPKIPDTLFEDYNYVHAANTILAHVPM